MMIFRGLALFSTSVAQYLAIDAISAVNLPCCRKGRREKRRTRNKQLYFSRNKDVAIKEREKKKEKKKLVCPRVHLLPALLPRSLPFPPRNFVLYKPCAIQCNGPQTHA